MVGKREDKSEVRVRKMADPLWVAPAAQAAAKEDKAASAAADSPPDNGKPPQEGPEVADTLVLCWSEGREQKETAICSQAEEKYLKAIEQLSKRMAGANSRMARRSSGLSEGFSRNTLGCRDFTRWNGWPGRAVRN